LLKLTKMKKIYLLASIGLVMLSVQAQDINASINFDQTKIKTEVVYEFSVQHMDGHKVPIKLIKITGDKCQITKNGDLGCIGGYTSQKSDNTRKQDSEHPVDTNETVFIEFKPGKIPSISKYDLYHELVHVNDFHWNSRSICETNWRYPDCMEQKAYNYIHMLQQIDNLQKNKQLKLI